jgi:hypothetical protein
LGIPKTTQVASSWAIVAARACFISAKPSASCQAHQMASIPRAVSKLQGRPSTPRSRLPSPREPPVGSESLRQAPHLQ